MKKISIIVPVYNIEDYIEECVNSIINQDYKDFELILVDDGAKDNSGKICDDLSKKDDRIFVIHNKTLSFHPCNYICFSKSSKEKKHTQSNKLFI